jgi:heme oxygenase
LSHPALEALRAGTDDVHRRLEASLPLVRPDLTEHGYHAVLGRFWGLVAPLEEALDRAGVPLADWPERRKAALLEADLPAVDALPRCGDLPPLDGDDAVLGCLYVLEGSTLGGRHVAAHVERTLGVGAVGTRYFRSYGGAVGARWRAFRAGVARRADAGGDVPAMVGSARATFEAFDRWLVR